MKHFYLILCLCLTACHTAKRPSVGIRPQPCPADNCTIESASGLRTAESVRLYHVGRFVDPNQSAVMHEQHPVYRVEASARWNLRPQAGPTRNDILTQPPRDAAYQPLPVNDALAAEMVKQKDTTAQVALRAVELTLAFEQLKAALQEVQTNARTQNLLGAQLQELQKRLEALENVLPQGEPSASSPPSSPR
jgi:hypothetical protein